MCIRSLFITLLCAAIADAVPIITFPINSQVPPVARISSLFDFTFSDSTFTSSLALTYTLSNAPSWLSLDGGTRTLSGTPPSSAANTAPVIQITATDSTGSATMNTTLVVTGDSAPEIVIPLEDQLPNFGAYSAPSSILYYPSSSFTIKFNADTFSSGTYHYAVTQDNTPLPSWIQFSSDTLTFTGVTPDSASLVTPPQTFGIELIASDVEGFSQTVLDFDIVVANHELAFTDAFVSANTSVGDAIVTPALRDTLRLDGNTVAAVNISSVKASAPSWLTFDNSTYELSGTAPANATSANVTITVTDVYQDVTSAIVFVNITNTNHTLFTSTLSSANATMGSLFEYDLSSAFSNPSDVSVSVSESPSTSWLSYNSTSMILSGNVPTDVSQGTITVTINASSKSTAATSSQSFDIRVLSASTSTTSTTDASATSSPTSAAAVVNTSSGGLSKGAIAAAVVVPVVVVLAALILCICCLRRRDRSGPRSITPSKSDISRPVVSPDQMVQIIQPRMADEQTHPAFRNNNDFNDANMDAAYIVAGKRYSGYKRRSQSLSTMLTGPLSSHARDSQHGHRSLSETAIPRADDSLWETQDESLMSMRSIAGSSGLPKNFSRKGSSRPMTRDESSGFPFPGKGKSSLYYGKYRMSASSIQQTPAFAYDYGSSKLQRTSSRRSGITSFSRRLSSIGHGSRLSGSGSSSFSELRSSRSLGHGRNYSRQSARLNSLTQTGPPVSRTNSWLTVQTRSRSGRRRSQMSDLTESTDVLYSLDAHQRSIKLVPKSPVTMTSPRFSTNSSYAERVTHPYARPISRRDPRESPFFGGSSRSSSRATSRKSPGSIRGHQRRLSQTPEVPAAEITNNNLERSIMAGLHGVPEESVATRDSLGISYGSARDATGQLKSFVKQMAKRLSRGRNSPASPQFDLEDSRFNSPVEPPSGEPQSSSPTMGLRPAPLDRGEHDRTLQPLPLHSIRQATNHRRGLSEAFSEADTDFFDRESLASMRDSNGNMIQYDLDESPELGQAVARPSISKPFGSFRNGSSRIGSPAIIPVRAQENFRPGPGKRPVSVDDFHNDPLGEQMGMANGAHGLGLRKQTSFVASYAEGTEPSLRRFETNTADSIRSFDSGPAFL